jgi:hypothetical protein
MTEQQQQILDLAMRLNADPREVEEAIRLMRTGRFDLIIAVTAKTLSVRAALKKAATNSPRTSSRAR